MTPEQYWEGDPYLVRAYYKAHKLRIEQRNQELWLQGLYIYDAVAAVVGSALSKRNYKYREKPIEMFPDETKKNEEVVQKERDKAVEAFKAMRKAWENKQNG